MSCLCSQCVPTPAPTYTEAYRAECEAKWVLGHRKEWRSTYYENVAKKRGEPAAMRLMAAVKSLVKQQPR